MPRGAPCWKKICAPLYRRDRRVSGLLADHSRGGQALRGDGHGADRPPCCCSMRPVPITGDRPPDGGRGCTSPPHDAAARPETDQGGDSHSARADSVQEAANLQADLRRAGIEPWAWVVNPCSWPSSRPPLAQRALRQQPHIAAVREEHGKRYAVVPLQAVRPVGLKALQGCVTTRRGVSEWQGAAGMAAFSCPRAPAIPIFINLTFSTRHGVAVYHAPFDILKLDNGARLIFTPCPGTKGLPCKPPSRPRKPPGLMR